MSPILIRPVREQLEHDRLIRHLANKYKKKYEVNVNIGDEQVAPVKIGSLTLYPDVVWTDGKRLAGLAEVETSESVNNLEAMAQWVHFSSVKVPFHLYVPVQGYDAARRLCEANQAKVSEIWTYRASLDGFDLVRVYADATAPAPPPPMKRPVKPAPVAAAKPGPAVARPAAPAKPAGSTKPAVLTKPAGLTKPAAAKASAPKAASKPAKATKTVKAAKRMAVRAHKMNKGGVSKSSKGSRSGGNSRASARKPAPRTAAQKSSSSIKKKGAAGRGR